MSNTEKKPTTRTKKAKDESKKPGANQAQENKAPETDSLFRFMDKFYQANLGKITAAISPAAIGTSYFSWLVQRHVWFAGTGRVAGVSACV